MIDTALAKAINEQINKEFYSSYLYLAMAAHFDSVALPGFAKWMKAQAAEEWGHGMKFYEYLYEVGASVELKAIELPPAKFGSPKEIFEMTLEHEKEVTASINAIYALAKAKNDPKTELMLHWFINEQVEEEKNARDLIDQLGMAGSNSFGIMFMDQHVLGARKAE
ncbi:MAG TPA: ferritin [Treponemataceae bacterium]|nr:ferritin [Treponemataceae bacterium]HPS43999.1 ferritin [Treponemataceae bacterium]